MGKNTGAGCHFLLQAIFLTKGLNLDLLHCRQILNHLSHQGSPVHTKASIKMNFLLLDVDHFLCIPLTSVTGAPHKVAGGSQQLLG